MNFYKRYMGDYAKKTAHLSLMEHGAYTLMLDALYATEKGLPPDYAGLFRICRAMSKPEQLAVAKVADEFFPICEDGLRHNARAAEEIHEAAPAIEAARENGKKGGRPRKEPAGFSEQNPDETQGEPSTKAPQSHSHISPSLRSGERAHRLPKDWRLPDEYRTFCRDERPELDPDAVAAKFADYWHAAKDGRKRDWLATWRNWVRAEHGPSKATQQKGDWRESAEGLEARAREAGIPARRADEQWPMFRARVVEAERARSGGLSLDALSEMAKQRRVA